MDFGRKTKGPPPNKCHIETIKPAQWLRGLFHFKAMLCCKCLNASNLKKLKLLFINRIAENFMHFPQPIGQSAIAVPWLGIISVRHQPAPEPARQKWSPVVAERQAENKK
jgi:hypothetical protein